MSVISTTVSLYRVLLMTAMILLTVLLYNNLVLYRRKLSDRLSLMLLSTVVMCAFELLWNYCGGHPNLRLLSYIGSCGYAIAFLLFGATFNWFFLEQFDLAPRKKWLRALFYEIPILAFIILCVTTPWTRLVFWVDRDGAVQEMVLFRALFYVLLLCYLIGALVPAFYFAFVGRSKNSSATRVAKSMIVFSVLAPAVFLLQIVVIGDPNSDYLALSLSIAVALVYLSTNVSTHLLLETQAKVETVETDLRIAANIQADALPPVAPEFADHLDVNLRASMNTAREVGGDFYDYFAIDDHRMCFLIADVSGKGTPAALFMMTAKTMIKDYALTHDSTAEIFTAVNRRLCENNDAGMPTPITKAAAYCRVSTDSEEQESSYEAQVNHYTSFIQSHPGWELAGIFADEGLSGTQAKTRPQFNALMPTFLSPASTA